jgi:hypothetical protein
MKRCLMLLVALATIPSTYALPTGEFPIAAHPTGFAPHDRRNIVIAATETVSLAVWEDFRVDPNQPPRIWATRIATSTGKVLDTTGIQIVTLPASTGTALRAVGTDGTDFLIAWTEDTRLKFAKVAAGTGEIVARTDTILQADKVSITSFSGVYAVFYTVVPSPTLPAGSVEAVMLDGNASVLIRVSGGVLLSTGILDIATTNGTNVVHLAWSDIADGTVHAFSYPTAQLASGNVTRPATVPPIPSPPLAPLAVSVASNGGEVFAAWYERTNPPIYRVRRFDGAGVPLTAITDVAPAPLDPAISPKPGVVWAGGQYVVTFQAADDSLQTVRYAANGTRIDVTPLPVAQGIAGLATSQTAALDQVALAWLAPQVSGAQVDADFLVNGVPRFLPGHLSLSTGFVDRSDAVVLWRGDHYLAAWRDESNVTRVAVGRISADGVPLDGDGIDVSVGIAASAPVLASNGHTAVVTWQDANGVSASFVDEAGHVSRRMFDFPGGKPSVNWNGQQYLVAWRSSQNQLLGLRMNGAGALIDFNPVTIAAAPPNSDPVIGWTGNSYVFVYTAPLPIPIVPAPIAVLGQFVSPALTAIGSPIQVSGGISQPNTVGTPIVADGPAGALIIWPQTAGGATTLRAARAVNGALIDSQSGFAIGEGSNATAYGSAAGWGVVSGPFLWNVSPNGTVSPRFTEFPSVQVGTRSLLVLGGPAPLLVYRRPPVGSEQAMQVVGRYLFSARRERAVRH